jgi:hypothetical protein
LRQKTEPNYTVRGKEAIRETEREAEMVVTGRDAAEFE